jgi:hypothetical protein
MGELYANHEAELDELHTGKHGCLAGALALRFVGFYDVNQGSFYRTGSFGLGKVAPAWINNSPRSPLWSYRLGLQNSWIPTDPRVAVVRAS